MASVERVIQIIFAGVDNVSGTLDSIGSELETFGTGLQDIGAPFADAAEKVLILEATLAAMAVGGYALAVTKAGEFSAGMAEVNSLLDITDTEFADLSAGLIEYSTGSTALMTDLQSALYNLISLGGDYETSLESLAVIEKLSVAAKADMTTTTETLIGTMNAYGAGVDEASSYSDAFFTIIQDGKTTLPELSRSIAQVTGIAATAGIDFETLGAAIAAMTASGAPTSQAITSIKAAIQAMVAPTKLTSEAAANLGIELGQASIKSQGFEVVLKQIYDAANGDIEVIKTMIPSIEGLSAASILGADSAGTLAKALEDMDTNTGATIEAFDKMEEKLKLTWQTMENNWNAIWILFGTDLGDQASLLIEAVTNLFKAIGTSFNEGDFDGIITFINGFVEDLTGAINQIAENIPDAMKGIDFADFISSLEGVVETVKGLFDDIGIDLTSVEGLQDAIDLIAKSIETLQGVTGGIITAFKPLVSAVMGVAEAFSDADTNTAALVGQIIGFGVQLGIVGGILGAGGAFISGVAALAGLFASGGLLSTGIAGVLTLLTGPVGLVVGLGLATKGFYDFKTGQMEKDLARISAEIDKATEETLGFYEQINALPTDTMTFKIFAAVDAGELELAQQMIDDVVAEDKIATLKLEVEQAEQEEFLSLWNKLSELPESTMIEITALMNEGDMEAVEAALARIEEGKSVIFTAEADTAAAKEELAWFDAEGNRHTIMVDVDTSDVDTAKEKIEDIPTEKMLEIKLQGDIDTQIASIIANADIAEAAFEWTAKVDIAEAAAAAVQIEAAFEAASDSVDATASAASSMFGDLAGSMSDMGFSDKWRMQDILDDQMEMEGKALDAQIALNESQIAYMDARTEAMEAGDSLITIDSNGLEPALEMVLWQVLEKVQVKASAEASDFLLGI
ncbi:MAG: phage tail tape measure protein [Spirochaetales bacterium]|jgi:TP901 family phage tail tape measure protein|nr:phage tail tape measure protein [Spirochaetales bacterium]